MIGFGHIAAEIAKQSPETTVADVIVCTALAGIVITAGVWYFIDGIRSLNW